MDEPWDGPNNSKLLLTAPNAFIYPSAARQKGDETKFTSYVAVVGDRTAWTEANGTRIRSLRDGTANTVLLLEHPSAKIPWTEPRDLTFDDAPDLLTSPDKSPVGPHRVESFFYEDYRIVGVAAADGSVCHVTTTLDRETWSSLLTVNDGRPTDFGIWWINRPHGSGTILETASDSRLLWC